MAIASPTAEFIVKARSRGVDFGDTLTLGRQNLFASPIVLENMLRANGCWPADLSREQFHAMLTQEPCYADPLLTVLGAATVAAMDINSLQGAAVLHDLNHPVPQGLNERFDTVLDGGLLEHVFNFPTAIKSCMEMVKVGGHLILLTTANNNCGHGFYQFSPELFFRVLSEENGFRLDQMVAFEIDEFDGMLGRLPFHRVDSGPWHEIPDPAALHERVSLSGSRPILLNILATRISAVPIFDSPPQQTDYSESWSKLTEAEGHTARAVVPLTSPVSPRRGPARQKLQAALWSLYSRRLGKAAPLHLKHVVYPAISRWLTPRAYRKVCRERSVRDGERSHRRDAASHD